MTPTLEHLTDLAVGVTSAEATHAKAADKLRVAQEARDAVAARLADLAAKRQAIVVRRSEGDHRDDDAETSTVVGADVDGLRMLLGRHEGVVAEAQGAARAAADAAVAARVQFARAEAKAAEQALVARAEEAQRVLAEALTQLRQIRDTTLGGGMVPFRPSDELWNTLTPLRFGRPW